MDLMPVESDIRVPIADIVLVGSIGIPANAQSVVVFAHGSGSSRLSPRNQHVAGVLQKAGFGTVLVDLLTPEEETVDEGGGMIRFDIALLASRLAAVCSWLANRWAGPALRVGYFGASTGAAAALVAAADKPHLVSAVVSRGGRPDLAGEALERVKAPTLLIVGGADRAVLVLNEQARRRMPAQAELSIVPGATHLFEEPGALSQVADLSVAWFQRYLPHISPSS